MMYPDCPIIQLPVSKSVANRLLVLQARAGRALLPVDGRMPEDVWVLREALETLGAPETSETLGGNGQEPVIDVGNCGTGMRFLAAYCALAGKRAVLTGCERMKERPIGQLAEALRGLGAEVEYMEREGFPPLRIRGILPAGRLRVRMDAPRSTQFVSALLLLGVEVETDCRSPYIEMTRRICDGQWTMERDWSAAAFWYEWVALHGGRLFLSGLRADSRQGDKAAAEVFALLGVQTAYTEDGVLIERRGTCQKTLVWDFAATPDLYPAVALSCERLGVRLEATGTESLTIKESDRLRAVREHKTYGDHRIAMALLAADLPCDDMVCVAKSYPGFMDELAKAWGIEVVVPRRGVNDEGKGKKWALRRLVAEARSEYVWLRDDDVSFAEPCDFAAARRAAEGADLLILPLRMRTTHTPSLLEWLQMAEYAAIQGLTIAAAQRGRAVMCSGANMIVRRTRWLEAYEDLHPELASGDDMFLLESFKRRGLHVAVSDAEGLTATLAPETTWRGFFRQRMRWAGKAAAYKDKDILRCGAAVTAANVLQLLCPLIIVLKFPLEYALIRSREPQTPLWTAFLLELLYPWYLLICLAGGLLTPKKQQNF